MKSYKTIITEIAETLDDDSNLFEVFNLLAEKLDCGMVVHSCQSDDGSTGFAETCILCESSVDVKGVLEAIQANPDNFEFPELDEGQKRLVNRLSDNKNCFIDTVYID